MQLNSSDLTVAVYMITYNHGNYVEQAVESVMNQKTNFKFKLYIGEDCSTDDTRKICLRLKEKYPDKIELVLNSRNIGAPSNAQNIFKLCIDSGAKYVAILEGDDYWTDSLKLQKQVRLLEKNIDCSMCVALYSQLSVRGLEEEKRNEGESGLKLNFPAAHGRYFHTATYLIRATALQTILKKYRDLFIGDTAMRYLLSAEGSFVLLNDYVSVYRITGTGVWTSLTEYDKVFAHYEIFSKFRKKHIKSRTAYYLEREISYLHSMLLLKKETDLYYKKEYYKLVLLRHKIRYQTKLANIRGKLKDLLKW